MRHAPTRSSTAADPASAGAVLVTGAAGFVGSHLVEALLGAGHTVLGVDRRTPTTDRMAAVNLAAVRDHPRLRLLHRDIVTDDLTDAVAGCVAVYHLAAIPGVRASWGSRFDEYARVNIIGTRRVLDACVRAGIRRVVVASSSSVYGSVDRPSRETDVTRPISPYGVTKLASEQLCLASALRHPDLVVCALRYFTVYGPRQRPDMAIGRVLTAALDGNPMTLFGDGGQQREFTYVADVVAATIEAGSVPQPPPIVNVGGGASVTMNEVIKLAEKLTDRPVPIVAADWQAGDVAVTGADLSLAERSLGYRATVGLEEGMGRHVDWLRRLDPELRRAWWAPGSTPCAS
jgi:nucleoside-diphosphate-sugar epimerase